ncbi:ngoBIM [Symbiodinium sp. CCMP2592]|nr:ngoBIM [Symbiodinium sp. CCMP2592]
MSDGLLLSVSAYAQDVLAFASTFLNKCGFLSAVPRSAPIGIAAQTFASVEERNEAMLRNSFLRERFTQDYEQKLYKCGIRLAVFNTALRQLGSAFNFVPRSDMMANSGRMDPGFRQFISPLPSDGLEMAALYESSKSLWATDQGYFYCISLIPATVCASRKFVTETMMPFCEVIKGDLDETMEDFRFSKKKDVTFAYLGDGDDFGLFLDGYTLDRVIMWRRVPLVMKFQRHLDAIGRPYTVTLCRCGKWGRQVDFAMRFSGTRNPGTDE